MKSQMAPVKNPSDTERSPELPALERKLLSLIKTDVHLKSFLVEALIEKIAQRDIKGHESAACN